MAVNYLFIQIPLRPKDVTAILIIKLVMDLIFLLAHYLSNRMKSEPNQSGLVGLVFFMYQRGMFQTSNEHWTELTWLWWIRSGFYIGGLPVYQMK